MRRFNESPEEPCVKGAPMWMVTFGDLMSLLLCFFVLLLSFSETDRYKYKQVAGSLEKAFGVQRKEQIMQMPIGMKMIARDFDQQLILSRIEFELNREIDETLATYLGEYRDQIELESSGEKIVIRLMGESTFDSGSVEIREKLKPLLLNISKILQKSDNNIIIAGHTDNVPIHNSIMKNNLRLSIARAAAVAEYLLENSEINPKRVSTMGFGEFRPIESNDTEAGKEKNRRVEIILGKIPVPSREVSPSE
jgi:chemotaxis protein MotB